MALSEFKHHSSRRGRIGPGEVRVEPHGGAPEALPPQGGSLPPCLDVPRGPQVGLERHFSEHMADICPFVQMILDAPVPAAGRKTWRASCGSWISRLPSRLLKCPRHLAYRVLPVLLFLNLRRRTVGGSADRLVSSLAAFKVSKIEVKCDAFCGTYF